MGSRRTPGIAFSGILVATKDVLGTQSILFLGEDSELKFKPTGRDRSRDVTSQ